MEATKRYGAAARAALALAVTGLFASSNVMAADAVAADKLPPELRQLVQAIVSQPRVSPGVVFGSPVAFGARDGDFFLGLNGATAETNNDFIGGVDVDGSAVVGAGLGDPVNAIGVELAFNIISLTDNFGDSGALAFKFHRNIGTRGALAIGTENSTFAWGEAEEIADATTSTEYISYSHYFQLNPDNPRDAGGLMLTVGAGDGRLGTADDPEDYAPFVSLGYAFTRDMSVIIDYAGEATNFGLSWVPWHDLPVSIVLGGTDLTEERGSTEFAIGIGYSGRY